MKTCTCVAERCDDRSSIKENQTLQTYDPWGLDSGQSECTTQVARAAGGIISYGSQHSVENGEKYEKKMF